MLKDIRDFVADDTERHLFVAAMPTPNGRLHIGHIFGPFLRGGDILNRYYAMIGHTSFFVSGLDVFDSYISWSAHVRNASESSIAHDNFSLIKDDLTNTGVKLNCFINLLEEDCLSIFNDISIESIKNMLANKVDEWCSENMIYNTDADQYIDGAWLAGNCPNCDSEINGYFCEACSYHFSPEDIKNIRIRDENINYEWRKTKNVFINSREKKKILDSIRNLIVDDDFKKLSINYLNESERLSRLTSSSGWGERFCNATLFDYGFVYAYIMTIGQVLLKNKFLNINPTDRDSEYKITFLCGQDNVIPVTVGCSCFYVLEDYMPLYACLMNPFLKLDGEKMSTIYFQKKNLTFVR